MKTIFFDDFEDLVCDIADKFDELDKENFEDIAVIAKPNDIKEIFKELICIGYDICNITYERIDWDGYDDEYVLSMNHEGIWLEKFMRDGKYYEDESTVIYILDNCSSKVIPHCKGKNVFEVSIGEEDDDCDECECHDEGYTVNGESVSKKEFDAYVSQFKHDDKPVTSSKSEYFINGKSVDKSEFDKKYEEFEEMYLDNIRDMLLNYCEIMDEMNEWRKLLGW